MAETLTATAQRVQDTLKTLGVASQVVELPQSTRSAVMVSASHLMDFGKHQLWTPLTLGVHRTLQQRLVLPKLELGDPVGRRVR
jgi:hypothetical protein